MNPDSNVNLSLGEFLRQEREKRGFTVEQVSSATKIGVRLLQALEADLYSELPAKPFIHGFIHSYARFIGIDPQLIFSKYTDFIDKKGGDRPNRESNYSGYAFEKREGEQSRLILGLVLGSFILIGGVAMLIFRPSFHHHRSHRLEQLKGDQAKPAASSSPPQASPAPLLSPGPALANSTPAPALPIASPSSTAPALAAASPVPTTSQIPTPAPVVSPPVAQLPTASPSPAPAPAGLSPASKVQPLTASSAAGTIAEDPLDSGLNYKPNEKFKAVFKATEDVWIRYRIDQRAVRKYPLRQGRTLVLRAQQGLVFQASKADLVQVTIAGVGTKILSESKKAVLRHKDATLFLPQELAEAMPEPFPGEASLFQREVPPPASSSAESDDAAEPVTR